MRQSMMCLEFRQGPRSIYSKNGHTGHTIRHDHGFASEFDNVDTAPRHTVHPNPKQTSRLFFLGGGVWKGDTPLQRRRFRLYFANAQNPSLLQSTPPPSFSRDIAMSAIVRATNHPHPPGSFYTLFSHDRTIKRFSRITFAFARGHVPPAFFSNFDGILGERLL